MDKNSKIGIVGYGVEGQSVVEYLLSHGYPNLTVCDVNEELSDVPSEISLRLGSKYLDNLADFDYVFRSPGIRLSLLDDAKCVTSATKLFFEKCPCKIIGVSGTKGKGTCCSLMKEILGSSQSRKVFLGGNIGVPQLSFLDELEPDSIVILELSSFQLQDLTQSPHVSVLLNTTSDHLDYHANVAEYKAAKAPLLKYQSDSDFAILNKDYPYFDEYSEFVKGSLQEVSVKKQVSDGKIHVADFEMSVADVGLRGAHNLENVLPAITVGKIFEIPNEQIAAAVSGFEGLPHRIEFAREVKGVSYYNDSCSTTPETSIAGVCAFDGPLILIAGGSSKEASFEEWGRVLCDRPNLETVILIGETAPVLEDALCDACGDKKLKILHRISLEEATLEAYVLASPGTTVLLSPGCASFDMFKNYKERGNTFKEFVLLLH